jgi:hypothetical protein
MPEKLITCVRHGIQTNWLDDIIAISFTKAFYTEKQDLLCNVCDLNLIKRSMCESLAMASSATHKPSLWTQKLSFWAKTKFLTVTYVLYLGSLITPVHIHSILECILRSGTRYKMQAKELQWIYFTRGCDCKKAILTRRCTHTSSWVRRILLLAIENTCLGMIHWLWPSWMMHACSLFIVR